MRTGWPKRRKNQEFKELVINSCINKDAAVCTLPYLRAKREKGTVMAFKPINTQEEFDTAIKDRLEQKDRQYEGYLSPEDVKKKEAEWQGKLSKAGNDLKAEQAKVAERDKAIAERDAKIKGYETDSVKKRIAREVGLPEDAVDFMKGENIEDLKKSAEDLKKIVGEKINPAPPLKDTEGTAGGDAKNAPYKKMLKELKGEE